MWQDDVVNAVDYLSPLYRMLRALPILIFRRYALQNLRTYSAVHSNHLERQVSNARGAALSLRKRGSYT